MAVAGLVLAGGLARLTLRGRRVPGDAGAPLPGLALVEQRAMAQLDPRQGRLQVGLDGSPVAPVEGCRGRGQGFSKDPLQAEIVRAGRS